MKANKYYQALGDILKHGKSQFGGKGSSLALTDYVLTLTPFDLARIFDEHKIARQKLKDELELYFKGETKTEEYLKKGISWWEYCGEELVNTYPTYMQKLPVLIDEINSQIGTSKEASKNHVLFLGETGVVTSQQPCLSLIHFQVIAGKLHMTVYQRSADANLGMPSDLYQLFRIACLIEAPLEKLTVLYGNVHIYTNNVDATRALLNGEPEKAVFTLNV